VSLRRPKQTARHPTPAQAFSALSEGVCLYAPLSNCTGGPASVGLRSEEDRHAVLVCKAHYGRLRKMPQPELERLEVALVRAFAAANV
jgi:hypothetical protein